ncbi:MAG: hypothetical protein ABEH64_03240 [Salinirussus sp.]
MDSLDDALAGGALPWRAIAGATAVLAGFLLAGIGTLSVAVDTAESVVGASLAIPAAATGTAILLTAILLIVLASLDAQTDRRRLLAGCGLVIGSVLVGWVVYPAGMPIVPAPVIAGVVGFAILVTEVLAVAVMADGTTAGVASVDLRPDPGVGGPTYADGGDDDEDLNFLLDDDE